MIVEFLELTFSRHDTCKLLCDTSLALARSSPTRRYTGNTFFLICADACERLLADRSTYHCPTCPKPTYHEVRL